MSASNYDHVKTFEIREQNPNSRLKEMLYGNKKMKIHGKRTRHRSAKPDQFPFAYYMGENKKQHE